MKRSILILWQSDFPPEARLQKEIKTLAGAGFEIHLLCNNRKAGPRYEENGLIKIHRMINLTGSDSRINRLVTIPAAVNPLWILFILKKIIQNKINCIHAVNLPMALFAGFFGTLFGIPFVYDMYENYPEAIRSWKLSGLKRVTRSPVFAQFLDDMCSKNAKEIIVVVDEARERLIKRGILQEKIHVVSNTVDIKAYYVETDKTIIDAFSGCYSIVYTGYLSPERGIETAVDALRLLKDKIKNIKLILAGAGPSLDDLKNYAAENGLEDFVHFTGWVDYRLFPSYVALSGICIIPQPSNSFIDTTIPNKLFEYMAMGRPVIASDAKPHIRIFSKYRCGEIFRSGSAQSFTDAVMKIYGNEAFYGQNGIDAVKNEYQWEFDGQILKQVYDSIYKRKYLKG